MSISKQFLKSKPECKVTFEWEAKEAESVAVAGDFNNWETTQLPLKKLKNGKFKGSINLPIKNSFEFRYVVDNSWVNDDNADNYVWNDFAGDKNGVLEL
ncbi:isoamylase early set domain-containing protein [Aquimarina agarivorans]|uniref:isoamylase early set domain-containing protein n=1 Tax=Aquimarina agarivorans TaxID=980584 RepID=UPI0002FFEE44|nr:isoamylase early set domain-containing protein [Aquimarina agarivorans]